MRFANGVRKLHIVEYEESSLHLDDCASLHKIGDARKCRGSNYLRFGKISWSTVDVSSFFCPWRNATGLEMLCDKLVRINRCLVLICFAGRIIEDDFKDWLSVRLG
ncbi:hypothetical protein [Bradyrhizobium elkanii]|uniref:hypothetical protein n=1 Tax=Bradyrhizobium elkanii TaxID=29448 RepID=UPI001674FF9E|nr:hypothetical protein [Bradyrhizobium elkanii]MCW2112849.1 hypothetical protein [Bradyrhizobium elkanii]